MLKMGILGRNEAELAGNGRQLKPEMMWFVKISRVNQCSILRKMSNIQCQFSIFNRYPDNSEAKLNIENCPDL
jgi:hypothetical protein